MPLRSPRKAVERTPEAAMVTGVIAVPTGPEMCIGEGVQGGDLTKDPPRALQEGFQASPGPQPGQIQGPGHLLRGKRPWHPGRGRPAAPGRGHPASSQLRDRYKPGVPRHQPLSLGTGTRPLPPPSTASVLQGPGKLFETQTTQPALSRLPTAGTPPGHGRGANGVQVIQSPCRSSAAALGS